MLGGGGASQCELDRCGRLEGHDLHLGRHARRARPLAGVGQAEAAREPGRVDVEQNEEQVRRLVGEPDRLPLVVGMSADQPAARGEQVLRRGEPIGTRCTLAEPPARRIDLRETRIDRPLRRSGMRSGTSEATEERPLRASVPSCLRAFSHHGSANVTLV